MRTNNKPLLIILFVLLGSPAWGQSLRSQLRSANFQYEAKAYAQAIESYKKILAQYPSDEEALTKIADCYWSINQMEEAARYYAKLIQDQKERTAPRALLAFAHVLKSMGRYEEAKRYYSEYAKTDPSVGNHFAATCDFARYQQSQPGEYTVVVEEQINSSAADFGPVIVGDQLIFASQRTDAQRPAGWDGSAKSTLFTARIGPDGYLSATTYLNTRPGLGPVTFSADGRYLAYTSNSFVSGIRQIPSNGTELSIVTAEATASGNWVNERLFPFNSRKNQTGYPAFSADGNMMIFASDAGQDGYGGYDLYVSYRKDNSWTKPVNLGTSVNTPGNEISPFYDGSSLFFASDWHQGFGGMDIFRADQQNGKWTKVTNLGVPLNSSSDDYGFVFDSGRNIGYLTSNRSGSRGAEDIFRVTKGIPLSQGGGLSIKVVNALDGSPVSGASIDLSACNPNFTRNVVTVNAAGVYVLALSASTNCDVVVAKEGFIENRISLYGATAGGNREIEVALTRKGEDYYGAVYNGQNQQPLSGVSVVAQNLVTGAVARAYSDQRGQVALSLSANSTFQVSFSAQGFREKTVTVNTAGGVNRNILGNNALFPLDAPITGPGTEPGVIPLVPPPPPQGFSIQIAAMSGTPDMGAFIAKVGGVGPVYSVFADGKHKVRVGPYQTYALATQLLPALRRKGFTGAFIATETGSADVPLTVPTGPVQLPVSEVMIQLGAYTNPGNFSAGAVLSMGPIIDFRKGQFTLKLLGGFRNAQDARNALPRVRSSGFPGAFLVEMKNGQVSALR